MLRESIRDMLVDWRNAEMVFEESCSEHAEEKRKKNLKRKHDKRHKRYERGGKLEENRYRHEFRSYNSDRCCAWNLSQYRRRTLHKELYAQLNEMYDEEMRAMQAAIEASKLAKEVECAYDAYRLVDLLEENRLWEIAEKGWDAYMSEQRDKCAKEFCFSDLSDVELKALEGFLSA